MVKRIEDKAAYLQAQTAKIGDRCEPFEGTAPLFTLKNVKFSVKDRGILKDISLEIPKGGRTVFLGENGCGKTTLMRLIARLYKPTGGSITQYIDEKFKQKPRGSRAWFKKVGVVYQNPDYQLFMPTVEKEINFGAPSPEYAEHIAELFGIKHLWHRHPQSLSEGQNAAFPLPRSSPVSPKCFYWTNRRWGRIMTGSARWWRYSINSTSRRATR